MEMLNLLVLMLLPVVVTSSCNNKTEWTCPQSSKCIPNRYKCDNVPDCTGSKGSPDETMECSLPPVLSDFKVKVITFNLESSDITWTQTEGLTNVTVDISYINGATGVKEAVKVYGRSKKCYDFLKSCADMKPYMCDIHQHLKGTCRKLCGICRVDTMRDSARFNMNSLLNKKATNIMATAYASNFKGDGPKTSPIEIPIPKLTAVKNLTITLDAKMSEEIWAILSWSDSKFVKDPRVKPSDVSIEHHLKRCRVIELSNGTKSFVDCKSEKPFYGDSKRKFYDNKYGTKYAFTVKPVFRYADTIVGPTSTVFLTTPAAPETKAPINILALSFGISGGVVFLVIVFISWGKYRRGENICDCDDDDDDKFSAQYVADPTLMMPVEG